MVYETSYECGQKPFCPDLQRGKWASPGDFVYACMGLAFKLDLFTISVWYFYEMGISAVIPNLFCMVLYLVPLMVIQSFMGQFASSGFISAFLISPFFKGMGYVSLALNIALLMYYNIFVAIPMLFLFNSFRPTLPWSCEGWSEWSQNLNESDRLHICNVTALEESEVNSTEYDHRWESYHIPSVLYFKHHFHSMNFYHFGNNYYEISWPIVACTLLAWAIIAFIFYKFSDTAKFGRLLRYAVWSTLVLLLICLLRFMFLPGAFNGLKSFFTPTTRDFVNGMFVIPIYALQSFGGGWGTIVALASFNKFKTNIMSYSWLICMAQMFIFLIFGLVSYMLEAHFDSLISADFASYVETQWILYISSASAIASLRWANLWSIIYYSMMIMAALIVMVTQIFAILKSLFDEFELLRAHKPQVTFGFIGMLALISLYFCSNHGILYFTAIAMDSLFIQTTLHLLLLLVVLWIYGRERFQRDIEFMLSQPFATWKVNMLRFVAPLCLIITLLATLAISFNEHFTSSIVVQVVAVFIVILPLLCIPGYGVFLMFQNTGSLGMRFRRACRPTDWYPLDSNDRQQYEESMGNADLTHQLREVTEDIF